MLIKTVGDLKKVLEEFSDDMPIVGYAEQDGEFPVMVYPIDADCEDVDDAHPATAVVVFVA